jgi:hypothetical protein
LPYPSTHPCAFSSAPAWLPQAALRPELLSALEARGTAFLPGPDPVAAVEDYCRAVIAREQTEDNFYV